MNETLRACLIICPFIFAAGFVDSVAGGGGVISVTGAMLAGLPVHIALGTNKCIMSFGTSVSAIKYFKNGKVLAGVAMISAAGAMIGAAVGSRLTLFLPERMLKLLLLAALPAVTIFLSVKKSIGADDAVPRKMSKAAQLFTALGIGLTVGAYDGLIGPGTGTFLILAFSGLMGFDLLTSSGCAKVSNLASNVTAMIVYVVHGKVFYQVAVPAILFCMAGNWLGARYALKGGSRNVRKIMYLVLGLLFAKVVLELCGIL